MAGTRQTGTKARPNPGKTLTLAEQLFAVSTRAYSDAAGEFLPATAQKRFAAIRAYKAENSDQIAQLTPVTTPYPQREKGHNLVRGTFRKITHTSYFKHMARAAMFVVTVGAGLALISFLADDTIRIEDELGKSALNNEFGTNEKTVSLRVMRKRKKIGEFTVGQGSKLRVVKATNGDAFRSEVAFTGNEADFKLKYKGKASVIVNNGPFKAKVRIPQGAENDVHLRFKELGSLQPVGQPQFTIEVIKGDVQIAEVDDDDFEQYKAGEKAIFSLSPADSESL